MDNNCIYLRDSWEDYTRLSPSRAWQAARALQLVTTSVIQLSKMPALGGGADQCPDALFPARPAIPILHLCGAFYLRAPGGESKWRGHVFKQSPLKKVSEKSCYR